MEDSDIYGVPRGVVSRDIPEQERETVIEESFVSAHPAIAAFIATIGFLFAAFILSKAP